MFKKKVLSIVFVFCSLMVFSQEKFTISGTIKSKRTGETVIKASVKIANEIEGAASNDYGFYSITLKKGKYAIAYSAIGYMLEMDSVDLQQNMVKDVFLEETSTDLENVIVTANTKGRSITNTQMGMERMSMADIKNIPMLLGERDVLKAIQLLPGIKSAGDGGSGFYVRGGTADQNLILLDEATVYNASHLLGFFSTFNSDAIKDVTVYKGGMPAQYGGRLSSVLDIKMNDGNNQDFSASGGIGLISAKLNLEGPIQKGKSSFLMSGRRTYVDLFAGLSGNESTKNSKLYFYDYNAKMNYSLGKKDKIYLSGYFGRDYLKLDKQFGLDWGNVTGTLRWNHIFNNKLFSNTSLIFSNFDYEINITNVNNDVKIFSQIKDINVKQEFQWYAGRQHTLRFGFNSVYHKIRPGEVTSSGNTSFNDFYLQNRYSWDNALFVTDTWKASPNLSFTYGLRLASFGAYGAGDFYEIDAARNVVDTLSYDKGALVKNYVNLEPRLAMSYILDKNNSIKASYVRNVQNLHLIANSSASFPTDKWIPSSNNIRPEVSDLVALGWYKNFLNNQYEFTTEVYYKTMEHQLDYKTGADAFTNDAIESQLLEGKGRAYGIEFLLKKQTGKFTGWLSYTLSKTERKIDGINDNEWYNARQDRTHDVAIVGMYQLNPKWTLSATWVYYTGDAITFPAGRYVVDEQVVYYYTKRNQYRMPDYHRLDFAATKQLRKRGRYSSELSFGLFNAYGRRNAYTITFRQNEYNSNVTEAVNTSLFRFVPSISYNFKF